jgi:hypothetical protein
VIEASSFQIIYWETFGRQIQDVLNRYHNTIREPTDLPEAPGSLASAIRRAVWSAWLRAPGPAGPSVVAAASAGYLAVASGSTSRSKQRCPR